MTAEPLVYAIAPWAHYMVGLAVAAFVVANAWPMIRRELQRRRKLKREAEKRADEAKH